MQTGQISFFGSENNHIELIYCKDSCISYPIHTHVSSYTLGLVLSGIIEFEQQEERKKCLTGDFFVVPPDTSHTFSAKDGTYSVLSVCLQKDFVNQCDLPTLLETVKKLTDSLVKKENIAAEKISMLREAIEVLYANLTGMLLPENEGVNQAKNLLGKAPENPFPIQQLSKQVFVSQYYLIRTFKKQFGLTPHQFQMQNRIRKAQHLLLQNKTITEVALSTGFSDQSHFDRWFRKILGITPSEYIQAQKHLLPPENN
ncbi:MAG: helix-turn-helix domain-containing protein [Anaerotignum sp.]|nr:helix-turn-helix domain-containing protein [Anaerotignum sp.]